ncbi:MAG: hemolysin family protein [Verrucomicrobiae bacterium]|nr:hemolysin family protein [Verrucomicrobiae bacterium]
MDVIYIIVIIVSGAASFFFAVAESSLFSLTRWQVKQLVEKNPEKGGAIQKLLSSPEELLATIAMGNTFANSLILAIAFTQFSAKFGIALTLVLSLFLILIVCEVFPKTVGVRAPEKWALKISDSMTVFFKFSAPLHYLADKLKVLIKNSSKSLQIAHQQEFTDEEYRELIDLAFQYGAVGKSEREIILNIIALDRRTVGDIMRPRSEMACISDDATVEEMIEAAKKYKYHRLPIYDETPDTIVGVLNTQALLLNPEIDLSEVIEMPSFVPSTMNLLKLFKSFQKQKRGLAIVLDEFGGTAGIVTMGDIIEDVVGKFSYEGEVPGVMIELIGEKKWKVGGTVRIEDFHRHCPDFKTTLDVDTIGGFVIAKTEIVPPEGTTIQHEGFKITVSRADERRVIEVLLEKTQTKPGPEHK